jgi:hypothetical protein
MSERLVIDPITRIEGHLRIEAQMKDGAIEAAYSSGTMVRGIEVILRGRDPRDAWAFAQRICGVCTLVHAIASVRAVEDALKIRIPPNAELIRNLMIGAQYIHDHVMHFYHLHALDWVDVVSALKADPKATAALAQSLSSYAKSSPGYFADVQEETEEAVRRQRPARPLPQRLLGPSGLQAAARSQPDGGGALPRGARLAARRGGAAHHPRRQEPASEFRRRRRAGGHQHLARASRPRQGAALPRRPGRHRARRHRPAAHPVGDPVDARVRRPGLRARHAGHRRLLQGLVRRARASATS